MNATAAVMMLMAVKMKTTLPTMAPATATVFLLLWAPLPSRVALLPALPVDVDAVLPLGASDVAPVVASVLSGVMPVVASVLSGVVPVVASVLSGVVPVVARVLSGASIVSGSGRQSPPTNPG